MSDLSEQDMIEIAESVSGCSDWPVAPLRVPDLRRRTAPELQETNVKSLCSRGRANMRRVTESTNSELHHDLVGRRATVVDPNVGAKRGEIVAAYLARDQLHVEVVLDDTGQLVSWCRELEIMDQLSLRIEPRVMPDTLDQINKTYSRLRGSHYGTFFDRQLEDLAYPKRSLDRAVVGLYTRDEIEAARWAPPVPTRIDGWRNLATVAGPPSAPRSLREALLLVPGVTRVEIEETCGESPTYRVLVEGGDAAAIAQCLMDETPLGVELVGECEMLIHRSFDEFVARWGRWVDGVPMRRLLAVDEALRRDDRATLAAMGVEIRPSRLDMMTAPQLEALSDWHAGRLRRRVVAAAALDDARRASVVTADEDLWMANLPDVREEP